MPTESIFHNIIIQDRESAEAFISALEHATSTTEKIVLRNVLSRDLSKEEIKKFFSSYKKEKL